MEFRRATIEDIPVIFDVQTANFIGNLEEVERQDGLSVMYETLQQEVAGRYDIGAVFVADDNPHSLRVHVDGLGMAHVGECAFSGKPYHIVAVHVRSGNGNKWSGE